MRTVCLILIALATWWIAQSLDDIAKSLSRPPSHCQNIGMDENGKSGGGRGNNLGGNGKEDGQ